MQSVSQEREEFLRLVSKEVCHSEAKLYEKSDQEKFPRLFYQSLITLFSIALNDSLLCLHFIMYLLLLLIFFSLFNHVGPPFIC